MWKDFFYYSRSERRAVCILLVLIAVFTMMIVVYPSRQFDEAVEEVSLDSIKLRKITGEVSGKEEKSRKDGHEKLQEKRISVVLSEFDPNLADSAEFLRLGLSPYVIRNVLKYRDKGGRFSTPESFSRIYGLSQKQFELLKPYIRISEAFIKKEKQRVIPSVAERKYVRKDSMKVFKYSEGTLVDVNLADTAELKKIPGIGSGIARAIVSYRGRLGGFHSLEQLQEIKYVTPELLEWFKLDSVIVRKLDINKEGLDKLRAHPYLNFYQAKVILEYRRVRGKISSLSQLSLYEEFTEKDLKRLEPYINFD